MRQSIAGRCQVKLRRLHCSHKYSKHVSCSTCRQQAEQCHGCCCPKAGKAGETLATCTLHTWQTPQLITLSNTVSTACRQPQAVLGRLESCNSSCTEQQARGSKPGQRQAENKDTCKCQGCSIFQQIEKGSSKNTPGAVRLQLQ